MILENGGSSASGGAVTASGYRYGFKGKENDNEVKGEGNRQDYGMRVYDPRLGRFLSVDPLSPKYPDLTPYQFASNSPLVNIDVDGLEGKGVWELMKSYFNVGTSQPKNEDEARQVGDDKRGMEIINASVKKLGETYETVYGVIPGYAAGMEAMNGNYGTATAYGAIDMFGGELLGRAFSWLKSPISAIAKRVAPKVGFNAGENIVKSGLLNSSMGSEFLDDGIRLVEQPLAAKKGYAFGLGDDLFNFAKTKDLLTYRDYSTGFDKEAIQSVIRGEGNELHFNLTGFFRSDYRKFNPAGPLGFRNFTNWEYHTITTNPDILQRTTFYKLTNGIYEVVPKPPF